MQPALAPTSTGNLEWVVRYLTLSYSYGEHVVEELAGFSIPDQPHCLHWTHSREGTKVVSPGELAVLDNSLQVQIVLANESHHLPSFSLQSVCKIDETLVIL